MALPSKMNALQLDVGQSEGRLIFGGSCVWFLKNLDFSGVRACFVAVSDFILVPLCGLPWVHYSHPGPQQCTHVIIPHGVCGMGVLRLWVAK